PLAAPGLGLAQPADARADRPLGATRPARVAPKPESGAARIRHDAVAGTSRRLRSRAGLPRPAGAKGTAGLPAGPVSVATAAARQPARGRLRAAPSSVWDVVGLGVTLCALVPALLPLAAPGMAATHDGFLHVQRLIALEAMVRQGAPFSRWLPDLAYGYGQPLWLYYAPLAYAPA